MRNYKTVIDQAKALTSQYTDARIAAYKPNPDLSVEGQEKATTEGLTKAIDTYGPQFDRLASELAAERDAKVAAAAKARPTLNLNDTAALVRSQQAWELQVRPLLDRGIPMQQALATADLDGVLGTERFAPTYLVLKSADPAVDQRGVVASQVARAFARLDPDNAEVILDGAAAEPEFAAATQALDLYRRDDALAAAITLAYAGTDLGALEGGVSSGE